jgi:hypothetical protein
VSVLSTVNFKVDSQKWELFTNLYPQRASKMLRDYVDRMVSNIDISQEGESLEHLQEKLNEYLNEEKQVQIKKETILAQLEEIEERKLQEEQLKLNDEEISWVSEFGIKIVENRGFKESFKSFQNVFKRFNYPASEYEKHIKNIMETLNNEQK